MSNVTNDQSKRNIRLDIEYNGRNYCGWQWQPDQPTIEGTIQKAVETILQEDQTIYSCGRTDAGVHAEQHVAHFFSTTDMPSGRLLRGINAVLPDDISVYHVCDMPLEWSARHDPIEREYRYVFFNDSAPPALFRDYVYWIRVPLAVEAMQEAARFLEGEHDFSAFRSTHCDAPHARRQIRELSFHVFGPFVFMKIRGTAFLRHQVRIMAGALLKVGLGSFGPGGIQKILESKDRNQAPETLAAHGLTLTAVRYKEDKGLTIVRPSIFDAIIQSNR